MAGRLHRADFDLRFFLKGKSQGCPEAERMLRFRDYLRSYPEAKKRYGDAKRELVKHDWDYIQQYADAKTDVIKEILAEADR